MAQIKAAEVQKLRKMTGAGMMDCKKALVEAEGDFDKAVEVIRERGKAIASKREERDATEGCTLAGANADNTRGVIVAINCETDFVAKNEDFIKLTKSVLELAIEKAPADLEALKALDFGGATVAEKVAEQSGVIGEKVELTCYEVIEAPYVSSYIHAGNKLTTIVAFNKAIAEAQMGRDVAMQVAAMSPVSVDKDDVAPEVVESELKIGREQARQEGKPENLLDKIAQGKLGKFYKENTLLNQDFVKESKMSVKQYLQTADKELVATSFKRFSL